MFVRSLFVAVMIAAMALVAAREVQAQVRFSIGGGGWSVGNAPPSYGPGYGYGYGYGRGPSYYNPPIIVERQVIQSQVRSVPVQSATSYQGQGVLIRNPAKTETTLSYTIDSQDEHEIAPGQSQRLTAKRTYVIDFDRGGDFGHACYSIYEGWYQFTLSDRGWELFRQQGPMPADETTKVKANPLPGQEKKTAEKPGVKQPSPPVPPQDM
jgi:hypothetical protein